MFFRVLGPVEITGPVGPVPVTAPRQQIVLAMLLAHAERVLPVDRLVAAIWDEAAPRTARSQVQICVSALRRLFAEAGLGERVFTRSPGYLVRAGGDELDLDVFQRCIHRAREATIGGDLAAAAQSYRTGLGLWRGSPFAGVDSRVVHAAAVSLTERRLVAVEECIEVELRLGAHHEVIGELTELVAEHPLRERLRGQLMLALYRAGRRPEALGTYRAARRTLVDELGLEPGERLRHLEQAILTDTVDADGTWPGVNSSGATAARVLPISAQVAGMGFSGNLDHVRTWARPA